MQTKIITLFFFIISFSCAKTDTDKAQKADPLIDSLFSPIFKHEYMQHELKNILNEIQTNPSKIRDSAVAEFALQNELYRSEALEYLAEHKSSILGKWLEKNKRKLAKIDWFAVNEALCKNEPVWRDSNVIKTLISMIEDSTSNEIKREVFLFFIYNGTFSESKLFLKYLNNASDIYIRERILGTASRFNSEENNRILHQQISLFSPVLTINRLIELHLKQNNRYDFLPDLYALRSKLQKQKDVTKIAEAKETLDILKEVIPYLEQKKSEKAPIGLPLDWGK